MMTAKRVSEPTGLMAKIPEGYYTRQQVADLIGRSKDTIRRWHIDGIYEASEAREIGGVYVFLYTPDDVIAMRKLAKKHKRVHKPKEGDG
ncbi:DNA binding protein [Gordonia phage DalanDe]|mgnify:CR=1 FL=1|nr:DNA binding protein [Gordonia phage DalanDe]